MSQNLSVESFKILESDLTANTTGTQERDQNGQVTALIKVVSSETGFVFDGGMMGIVKTAQKTGEIWVYVPAGIQKITIQHQKLGVLRDYYFPVSIEKGRTYELRLLSGTVRTIVENQPTAQFVLFSVEPANATVTIDDKQYSLQADGTTSQLLSFGVHTYRVEAPNYLPENGVVEVGPDKVKKNVVLKSTRGTITVNCDMPDAELYLNEQHVGTGSWTGQLDPAMYLVEARHEGYRSSSVSFTVDIQEVKTVSAPTPIPMYGALSITSDPAESTVLLDDVFIGETPMMQNNVLVGDHKLELSKGGYVTYTTTVSIEESVTRSLDAILHPTSKDAYQYVDLGLSVKWATCNVGASYPEECGDYFAWGEISPKSIYSWKKYKYCNGSEHTMTKYCSIRSFGNEGNTDSKTILDIEDDAAKFNWGGSWRMPTIKEWEELRSSSNCTWTWTTLNGVNGYKVQSKKDGYSNRWIFLPAAGSIVDENLVNMGSGGDYWSSTLYEDTPSYAENIYFGSSFRRTSGNYRYGGHTIRPVCP